MLHKNTPKSTTAAPPVAGARWRAIVVITALVVSACALPTTTKAPPLTTPSATLTVSTPTPRPSTTMSPSTTPTLGSLRMAATPTVVALDNRQRQQIFMEVWQIVNDNYVYQDFRGVDWQAVQHEYQSRISADMTTTEFYATIKEMIGLLGDDHSRYDTPQEAALDAALYSGEADYGGIGVMIRQTDQGMVVVRLAPHAPAEQAGLQLYDIIVGADDVVFDPSQFENIDYGEYIRGRIGTTVTLQVQRQKTKLAIPVVRNVIPSDAFPEAVVQRTTRPDVALLVIDSFNRANLDSIVVAALDTYSAQHEVPRGIIIDIRENYGGNIQSMLDVIAIFFDGGTIGSQIDRNNSYPLSVNHGQTDARYRNAELVLLTSGETASAAEMFAAGMRSLGDVTIIGETTAGNSENLYPYQLSDASVLWVAELLFAQTDGSYIDDIGIIPDIAVTQNWNELGSGNDSMLNRALLEFAP